MNSQDIIRETYDSDLKAQKTSLISASTIYAVVNTGASSGNVTLDAGSKTQIVGNLTLSDPKTYIGLVSVSGNVGFAGNVTLDAGSKTQIVGNMTLSDSKGFIGLTTSVIGNNLILSNGTSYIGLVTVANTVPVTGTFYQATQPVSFGNVTLSDSKGYIGSVSVSHSAWSDPKSYIGLVTIGNATLYAVVNTAAVGDTNALATLLSGPNQIGSVTVSNVVSTTFSGNVTLDAGSLTGLVAGTAKIGLVTLSPSNAYIGLTTSVIGNAPILGGSTNYIGLVTVANTVTVGAHALTASDAYVGLVSVSLGVGAATIGIVRMGSPMTIGASANYIGLVTTTPGSEYASSSIIQGMVSGASGAVIQLGSNSVSWCLVKAHPGNPTTVYVGPSLASVNVSFPLDPGETTGYSVNNTNLLYMCAVGTSELRFTGGL